MPAQTPSPTDTQCDGLTLLLAKAREYGEADAFKGKRHWPRYNIGMRLEVRLAEGHRGQPWSVTMHNIAGGGLGFWSRDDLKFDTAMQIREWSPDGTNEWLPVRVLHSSLGISGYLVGAAFETAQEAGSAPPEPSKIQKEQTQSTTSARHGVPSMRASFARVCIFACAASLVIGGWG